MMFLFRKLSKRLFVLTGIIGTIYVLFNLFYGEPAEFTNKHKIKVIEGAINTFENQLECRIPDIPLHSPEMLAFLKTEPPIICDDVEAWVTCGTNPMQPWLCSIQSSIVDRLGSISCDFSEVIRPDNDFDLVHSNRVRSTNSYELTKSDFVSVSCWTDEWSDRKYWSSLLVGVRKQEFSKTTQKLNELPFNVIMYGFDSLSKNAFIRKLPRTYKFLTSQLHTDVLKGYNIVGDGTPQAIIPLLTGYTELELPETRKRMKNSQMVNIYPFIFNEYSHHGFVTAFNEDLPNFGTFSYRLNGFREPPTDHYMRTFYLAFNQQLNNHKRLCVRDIPRHKVMLDYTAKLMRTYHNRQPQFMFSFHGELSHDSINLVGVADDDITNWLKELTSHGLLNRTILIMMSDHGNRFAEVRNTLQGKQEERLPFFSFTFPKAFKSKFSEAYANFKQNVDRLSTPFDIHETLLDILNIQNFATNSFVTSNLENIRNSVSQSSDVQKKFKMSLNEINNITKDLLVQRSIRSISLLKLIPKNRSCADAYIEPHWCSCLNLHFINTSTNIVQRAAQAIVNEINAYTSSERSLCHTLKVANVTWAGKLTPHQTLVKFKQNRDLDGYLADLTSTNTKITKELYQLQIHVLPGDSLFEASLTHNLSNDQIIVNILNISRINLYGDQASCIIDHNPDLRKFCFCRTKNSSRNK